MFAACQSDDNEIEELQAQPTIFQGRVLYSDTKEPVTNTTIWVTASENELFAGDVIIESKSVMLSDTSQGEFNITFSSDPRIDYFTFEVNFFDEEVPDLIIGGSNFANGMVCNPIDCDDYVPGNEYTDLTIVVPRPENN
jgi:hypothetical protein